MNYPFKIVVVSSFAPGNEATGPLAVNPGGLDKALAAWQPTLGLGDPVVELTFKSLEDFGPAALIRGRRQLETDASALTRVLHHPHYQAIESAWRGLAFLLGRMPAESVEIEIVNAEFSQLRSVLFEQVFKPEFDGITGTPAGLIVLDYDFDHKPASLEVLHDLARMGQSLQVPLAANTTAGFFGLSHLLHLGALKDLRSLLEGPEYTAWSAFRKKEEASWLCLCLNRFLLRPPFMGESYQEPASASKPENYLWGRGIWLLAANAVRAFGNNGGLIDLSGNGPLGEQAGLATRELPLSRKEKVQTPLEAVLPMPLVEMLPYFGLTPMTQFPREVQAGVGEDTVYPHLAVNLRSFTDPSAAQPGLLLVYATLAYSLSLGRASNLAMRITPELAGMDAQQAAQTMQARMIEELGSLGQGEVNIEPVQRGLEISLKPQTLIHGKPFSLEFQVPLG